ncbi:MAG: hypothetical protein VKJ04_11880 [Vampirovibrionales bacterium]|nr:hypothetical protein [Vampirovibrionales bacterium]
MMSNLFFGTSQGAILPVNAAPDVNRQESSLPLSALAQMPDQVTLSFGATSKGVGDTDLARRVKAHVARNHDAEGRLHRQQMETEGRQRRRDAAARQRAERRARGQ